MHPLKNKRVAILGLLDPGVAMVRFAAQQGAQVTAFGFHTEREMKQVHKELKDVEAEIISKDNIPLDALLPFDLIVITTGGHRLYGGPLAKAEAAGVPVATDLEIACERYSAPIIAVTGSNGKSSVVHLIEKAIEWDGKTVMVAGGEYTKFGNTLLNPTKTNYILMELNSTRLQETRKFRPYISVFLNLYAGHVDRQKNFAEYGAAKAKIFEQQTPKDFAVIQASTDIAPYAQRKCKAQLYAFSFAQPVQRGAYYDKANHQGIYIAKNGDKSLFSFKKVRHPLGPHHIENFLAALTVAKILKISDEAIQKMIDTFEPMENRMELVPTMDGVRFFNDAKSINVVATARALQSFPDHSVILIAGGEYKTNQFYQTLKEVLKKKAKILIIFGIHRNSFFKKWEGCTETYVVPTLNDAVYLAYRKAERNDNILFSPAATPEPMAHKTIPNRGKDFKRLIREQSEVKRRSQYLQDRV
jgi:UDP-N-acetylmuramoylalanine--D-glutamate ligase